MFFLQISAGVSNKSKAVIAIFVYGAESSCFTLLENGIITYYFPKEHAEVFQMDINKML